MKKVRVLLKLYYEKNYSARQAAKTIGIGKTSATEYLAGFKASGLEYSSIAGMSDSELLSCTNHKKHAENQRYSDLSKQFDYYFEKELKRTGVTLLPYSASLHRAQYILTISTKPFVRHNYQHCYKDNLLRDRQTLQQQDSYNKLSLNR